MTELSSKHTCSSELKLLEHQQPKVSKLPDCFDPICHKF